jgi:formate hydrogenlyase transcriptional activator
MPLDLQPKLLRVLQEQQFERLGSPQTIRVDIRLVAITNRDLPEMVRQRQFRDDLYYRLNVFPIYVPPLRQRRADIPLLVHHFMRKYGSRMRRQMHAVDPASMKQLVRADWPGNIRELENVIERAVILSRDGVLRVSLERRPVLRREVAPMNDAERDHILSALRSCGGRIAGANGAAALLGMKRTTLNSRMRKLGISRTTALHPAPL